MKSLPLLYLLFQYSHCICPSGSDIILDRECATNYTRLSISGNDGISKAIDICAANQAHPIHIHTLEEQSYLSGRIKQAGVYEIIGLVCDTNSKKWTWTDGSALDYKPPNGQYATDLDTNCVTGKTWVMRNDGAWTYYTSGPYSTDIFCSMQLPPLPVQSADGCNSFEDDSDDGVCFQVGDTAENWQDAEMICKKLGSNLASIHSAQENAFVRRLAVSRGAVSGVFLGATISGKGTDFAWIDGTDWDYTNFHPGFPIPGLGDCIAMDTSTPDGFWMNIDCSEKHPVACARDQKAVAEPKCGDGPWDENIIITSPGFPYNASIPCEYFLFVESGKKLEIEIVLLEANTSHDYLVLNDGFLDGHIIANLTGAYNNVTYTTSATNQMRVNWQPNGGVDVMGVAFKYRAV